MGGTPEFNKAVRRKRSGLDVEVPSAAEGALAWAASAGISATAQQRRIEELLSSRETFAEDLFSVLLDELGFPRPHSTRQHHKKRLLVHHPPRLAHATTDPQSEAAPPPMKPNWTSRSFTSTWSWRTGRRRSAAYSAATFCGRSTAPGSSTTRPMSGVMAGAPLASFTSQRALAQVLWSEHAE